MNDFNPLKIVPASNNMNEFDEFLLIIKDDKLSSVNPPLTPNGTKENLQLLPFLKTFFTYNSWNCNI
jgi:hypothetical protein